ncbi:UPF0755 protein [Murinocardiopsis flavida]|uniref:Endolytic murein transglycosylase n=1 Tax=Murinocardiopsis flavida TaxID=645275 RepID=A0A2P8DK88_9ACTN|nr:endolytic transglycosylase MltG [Murinocardiopsis flavida]PSK97642.1 UPF0755 protein [Murinocardiopsis flavida]
MSDRDDYGETPREGGPRRGRHGRHSRAADDDRPREPRTEPFGADPAAARPRGRRRKPESEDAGGVPGRADSGGFRSPGPDSGGFPASGPASDGFRSRGPQSGGFPVAGPDSGGFRSPGPDSGGFPASGPDSDGFRARGPQSGGFPVAGPDSGGFRSPDSGGFPASGPGSDGLRSPGPDSGGFAATGPRSYEPPRSRPDPFGPDPADAPDLGGRARAGGHEPDPTPFAAPEGPDPYAALRPRSRRAAPDPVDDLDDYDLPDTAYAAGAAAAAATPVRDPYDALRPRPARRGGYDVPEDDEPEEYAPPRRRPRRRREDPPGDDPAGGAGFDAFDADRDDAPLRRDLDDEPAGRARSRPFGGEPAEDDPYGEVEDYAAAAGAVPLDLPFDDDGPEDDDPEPRRRRAGTRKRAARSGRRPGPAAKRGPKRGRKASMLAVLVVLLFIGGVGTGGYVLLRTYVVPPDFEGDGKGDVQVVVAEGETGTDVGETLEEKGVVKSVRAFTNAMSGENAGGITPGTYALRSGMSAESALDMLLDPASRVGARVTIREGLRSTQILAELAKKTDIPLKDLKAAYKDTKALGLPDYAAKGPEGYLFPDTYTVEPKATAASLLKDMVARYKQQTEKLDLEQRADAVGLKPNEVMAAAAIIQAESGKHADMPKISRVVHNRLEEDMELGMDSSCFYVIDEYGIALTAPQLTACKAANSDYATYGRKGLPAGPFVSPGTHAIEAALDPAEGKWLYFVATDPENNVTEFAETYEDFEKLQQKFRQTQSPG